jgi:thiamine biosynthesis lipoprotein
MTSGTPPNGHHHVEEVMGTVVSIDVRDRNVDHAGIDEVVAWLHHVDATFSTYNLHSPISAMGRGELLYADASEEIRDVLRLCETTRLETGGAFDVFAVPAPNGTQFDPSGLVKGWSIERSAEILEANGAHNFCINAGGDVALRGRPRLDAEWQIGIQHPHDPAALAAVVHGRGPLAIATSATYARGTHIFDPGTGQPTTALASATVVGPDLTIADAYATAVFVMGVDGLSWIEDRPDYAAYVISHDGIARWSTSFVRWRQTEPAAVRETHPRCAV